MNVHQWRSELDKQVSLLDTQCDLTQAALDGKGGIAKTRVKALVNQSTEVITAYYRLVNAEKREQAELDELKESRKLHFGETRPAFE